MMEVGDYVRTKSYGIKKINGFSSTLEEDFIDCDYDKTTRILINKKDIVKSSPNIIDLIEVGDYVNGGIVKEITKHYIRMNGAKELLFQFIDKDKPDEVKSIVTKEQFESMEYKIGE